MRRAGLVCFALSTCSDSRSQGDAGSPGPRVEQTQRVWKPADVGPQGPDPTLACAPPSLSPTRSLLPEGHLGLTDACNAACGCQPEHYSPVCGPDDLMYYSPCHAGCPEAASPGPGGQKVSVRGCCPGGRWRPDTGAGRPPPLPPVISAVVALPRCTETVAVSLRIFPLVLAMPPQGNALQLVTESPSFCFSYSL